MEIPSRLFGLFFGGGGGGGGGGVEVIIGRKEVCVSKMSGPICGRDFASENFRCNTKEREEMEFASCGAATVVAKNRTK